MKYLHLYSPGRKEGKWGTTQKKVTEREREGEVHQKGTQKRAKLAGPVPKLRKVSMEAASSER